jgi:hypothetical protein
MYCAGDNHDGISTAHVQDDRGQSTHTKSVALCQAQMLFFDELNEIDLNVLEHAAKEPRRSEIMAGLTPDVPERENVLPSDVFGLAQRRFGSAMRAVRGQQRLLDKGLRSR